MKKDSITQKGIKVFLYFLFLLNPKLDAQSTYINDFIPAATDPVKVVQVMVWRIQAAPGVGPWSQVTQNEITTALAAISGTYSNIPSPKCSMPGITHISDSRIQFSLLGFVDIVDINCFDEPRMAHRGYYYDITNQLHTHPNNLSYYEENAINIYLVENPGGVVNIATSYDEGINAPYPGAGPMSFIAMRGGNSYESFPYWAGEALPHEFGHILGLRHSQTLAGWSEIDFNYGCNPNQTYSQALDYCRHTTNGVTLPCGPNDVNNMMNRDGGCYQGYLSPQQMAVMHYYLTTDIKNWLTPASYAAVTSVNHTYDYNVTSNETWNTPRYMKGDITVKAGQVLTIQCHLAMTHGAKILVEKTGKLFVSGGTITNISGRTWDGIYVWGDATLPQTLNPSNINLAQHQGWAKFNNATISHANIGVRNHKDPWSQNGGIITSDNSNFLNNKIDVQQVGPSSWPAGISSASWFNNTNFKTTTEIGDNLSPFAHVNLYRSRGASFSGCNFEYAGGAVYGDPGHGIQSVNSIFKVANSGATPSTFKYLNKGVFVNNYNPLCTPLIYNTSFINNLGYGAYFINANNLLFEKNFIQNAGDVTPWAGVYLNNCKYFKIRNNNFSEDLNYNYKASVALEIYNSKSGSHEVYRNTFSNSFIGINAMGDNSGVNNMTDGLRMNCNQFSINNNIYDISQTPGPDNTPPTVMRTQGTVVSPLDHFQLVRNIYGAACGNQNMWYIFPTSTKLVIHGSHNNLAPLITSPLGSCKSAYVSVAQAGAPYQLNYPIHCPITGPSTGGNGNNPNQLRLNMNQYITELKSNNPDNINQFEIQSTVASKLNLFVTDSLNEGQDSISYILSSNQGNMNDADIQTVFARFNKGDFESAQEKIEELDNTRDDWAALLTKIIEIEQNANDGIYSLNTNLQDKEFFLNYANTEGKDGQSIAKALLLAACNISYGEPHNYPQEESPIQRMHSHSTDNTEVMLSEIELFPNPTKGGVFIKSLVKNEILTVRFFDVTGRLIFSKELSENDPKTIDISSLKASLYLIEIENESGQIVRKKLVKE